MGEFDVVIVGGRVAGSTLASLLGARGLQVLLLDRATFPSDTLSTHVIYGDSFGVWERIGAWDAIQGLGSAKLWGISWIRDGRSDVRGRFWPNLVELDLRENRITDAGAKALLGADVPPDLAAVRLDGNLIGDGMGEELRRHFGGRVVCPAR